MAWGVELHENARLLRTCIYPEAMKTTVPFFLLLIASMAGFSVYAQERVWRCGNEYTNNAAIAQQRGCKVMEGGNVTVVQGTRPTVAAPATKASGGAAAPRSTGDARVDSADQRSRDGEARSILESELKKAEARQLELQKDYNNGEPEKQGSESRNYQKYLDRVAGMKADLARNQSDIAGIRRELGRLPGGASTGTTPAVQ